MKPTKLQLIVTFIALATTSTNAQKAAGEERVTEEKISAVRALATKGDAGRKYPQAASTVYERGKSLNDFFNQVSEYRARMAAAGKENIARMAGIVADECLSVSHDLALLSTMEKLASMTQEPHAATLLAKEYGSCMTRAVTGLKFLITGFKDNQRDVTPETKAYFEQYVALLTKLDDELLVPRFLELTKNVSK